jgi:ankyrin repeat protein
MESKDAMYGAIARGDTNAVRNILKEDPTVLTIHVVNKSWLHWAAQDGNIEIMDIFAAAGLPVDCLTSDGYSTPLDVAAGQGNLEACRWLLDHGAALNRGLGVSATPVFSAIYGKSIDVVKLFVERGANLNAVFGEEMIGVIRYAENYGTPDIVGFLKGAIAA